MSLHTRLSARSIALLEAITLPLVAGSTVVLAKLALAHLGPLTLSALRYTLAALILLPLALYRRGHTPWTADLWLRFFVIGMSLYVIGNGTLFLGLRYLPPTTASLLLSLIPLLVLLMSVVWLAEVPSGWQLVGVPLGILGSVLFFSSGLKAGEPLGIAIVAVGLIGNAAFSVMGRHIARAQVVDTVALTAMPIAVGAIVLLPIAFLAEGLPSFTSETWIILLVLVLVNTVGSYLIYNHALRVLTAVEVTMVLNLTPLVTAVWAWLALGDRLSPIQLLGMLVVVGAVLLVQAGRRHEPTSQESNAQPSEGR